MRCQFEVSYEFLFSKVDLISPLPYQAKIITKGNG